MVMGVNESYMRFKWSSRAITINANKLVSLPCSGSGDISNKHRYKFQEDLAIALQLINQQASRVLNAQLNGRLIDIKQNA